MLTHRAHTTAHTYYTCTQITHTPVYTQDTHHIHHMWQSMHILQLIHTIHLSTLLPSCGFVLPPISAQPIPLSLIASQAAKACGRQQ